MLIIHVGLNNPAFQFIWYFLDHSSRTKFAVDMLFQRIDDHYMNKSDFCQNPKNLTYEHFLELSEPSWHSRVFYFQRLDLVTFLILWLCNFMQKTRKKWWANSEILGCECWKKMVGWMNKQSQIHRRLPSSRQ